MSFTHSNGRSRIVMGVHACFTLFHGVSRTPLPAEQNRHKKCIQFTLSCQELSGVVRSCQELGVVRSCQELSGAVRSCQELSGAADVGELSGVVRSCQELSVVVRIRSCQELSGVVRSCQDEHLFRAIRIIRSCQPCWLTDDVHCIFFPQSGAQKVRPLIIFCSSVQLHLQVRLRTGHGTLIYI